VPEWTVGGTARYQFPPFDFGEIDIGADINYQSEFESVTLNAPFTQGQARTLVGASINWTDPSGLRVSLYGRNLLDEQHREYQRNETIGETEFNTYDRGRTFSLSLSASF